MEGRAWQENAAKKSCDIFIRETKLGLLAFDPIFALSMQSLIFEVLDQLMQAKENSRLDIMCYSYS